MFFNAIKSAAQTAEPSADEALETVVQTIDSSFDLGFWNTIIFAAVVAGITFIIIKILQNHVEKKFTGNSKIFYRLLYVAIIIVAVVIVLMTNKDLRSFGATLLASSGIAAVVIGLAAQGTLGNLFSGISISMTRPFVVGEYIEILNTNPSITGQVQEIGLRHTTIRDIENKIIVIPNGVLDLEMLRTTPSPEEADLKNFLFINVSMKSDLDKAISILQELSEAHENCIDVRTEEQKKQGDPKVAVHIINFTDWAVQLRASIWTTDVSTGFSTLSDLRYQIKKAYEEQGVEIPYPYQNVVMQQAQNSSKGDTAT